MTVFDARNLRSGRDDMTLRPTVTGRKNALGTKTNMGIKEYYNDYYNID